MAVMNWLIVGEETELHAAKQSGNTLKIVEQAPSCDNWNEDMTKIVGGFGSFIEIKESRIVEEPLGHPGRRARRQ